MPETMNPKLLSQVQNAPTVLIVGAGLVTRRISTRRPAVRG
ncbi:hypothetical protein [Alicyclobacillus acidoterrestris]|nr:hypothetical protein [Alicyclobacillus acidoterrestris]EPZ45643.1 hypothetical protein N007_08345 [Alicyclobacillus acidoterrestris ATCC 49025]